MPIDTDVDTVRQIIAFILEIGISLRYGSVDDDTFLPGIDVREGALIVDESLLLYPGDLLHEAGHLAVTPASFRPQLSGKVEAPHGNADEIEAAALCWSYAACVHLRLDPRVVFHEHGYHGRSESLLLNFELGVFPGLPELVSAQMALTEADAKRLGCAPFPAMQKWLRD